MKQGWKYLLPFLLLIALFLATKFPASRKSALPDPVEEVIFTFSYFYPHQFPWLTLQFYRSSFKVLKLQRDWIAEEMKELNLLNGVWARFCCLLSKINVCSGPDEANRCRVLLAQWLLLNRWTFWQPSRCKQHANQVQQRCHILFGQFFSLKKPIIFG